MIRLAQPEDFPCAAELAAALWEHHEPEALASEFSAMDPASNAVFLAFEEGKAVGFAHCSLRRDYVEGSDRSPTGYLEGIFVLPQFRRRGIAKALLAAGERWAKENGCAQFASDCELENTQSERFHRSLGFAEANRLICFIKPI